MKRSYLYFTQFAFLAVCFLFFTPVQTLSSGNASGKFITLGYSSFPMAADTVETDSLAIVRQWVIDAQNFRRAERRVTADSLLVLAREFASRSEVFMVNYMAYTESGHFYRTYRKPEKSRYYYNKALQLLGDEDYSLIARQYNNISYTYSDFYQYAEALRYQHKSLEYRYKVSEDEDNRSFGLAVTYMNIGRTYHISYRYEESMQAYQKAMEYGRDVNHPTFQFEVLSGIGELNIDLGNYTGALSYLKEAELFAQELQMIGRTVVSKLSLGWANALIGESDTALEYYLQAIYLLDSIDSFSSTHRAYDRLITLLLSERRLDDIPNYFREWEERLVRYPDARIQANLTAKKGYYNYLIGNHLLAETYFEEALGSTISFSSLNMQPEANWQRALNMAMIDRQRGFEMAETAITYTDEFRKRRTITGDNRAQAFRSLNPYYAQLASLYLDEGMVAEAFRITESSGSRAFAEDLMRTSDLRYRLEQQGLFEQFEALRNEIVALENSSLSVTGEAELQEITRNIRDLNLKSEAIVASLYSGNEELASYFVPEILSLDQARQRLGENEAGLRMTVHENGISAMLFSSNKIITWSLDISQNELLDKVTDLRDGIMNRKPLDEVNRSLDAMGHFLFSDEAREMLLTKERLVISPDGILSYIPFESLRLWEDTYMVENLIVSQTPSFTVREILRNRERPARTERRALAMANPVFEEAETSSEAIAWVERSHENLRPLPFSGMEGDWMKSYFPGEVDLLAGEMATESFIAQSDLNKYTVLHFATHGIMEDTKPRLSRIVLSAPGPDEQEFDGQLSVSEIYQLELSSDLVVLSACNTGLGRLIDGEGILGFQRAFLQAGSGSVAVTLWSVEDRSTAMLMRSFYQNLNRLDSLSQAENKPLDYAAALRKARLEMINRPGFNHPNQWAAFILTGI